MKRFAIFLLAVAPLAAQVSKTSLNTLNPVKPMRIARGTFADLERRFDAALANLGVPNDPIDMLGSTRGVYLDGYGVVFTAELSLVISPTLNPFRQTITKEMATQVHQRKIDRLPALRKAMREMVRAAATSLIQVPDNQLVVVAVRLAYLNWEDTTGLPGQILMRADRKSALAWDIKEELQ